MIPRYLARRHPTTGEEIETESRPPERSSVYLDWVRAQSCSICGKPGRSDAHHVGRDGTALKVDDYRTVPLCRTCHGRAELGEFRERLELTIGRLLIRYFRVRGVRIVGDLDPPA